MVAVALVVCVQLKLSVVSCRKPQMLFASKSQARTEVPGLTVPNAGVVDTLAPTHEYLNLYSAIKGFLQYTTNHKKFLPSLIPQN